MLLRSRRFWIGCAISLVLLFLFFYQVDFGEIGQALATARYIFVLPAVAVLIIVMGLKAWRWQYLLRPLKAIPLGSIYSIEVIGHMANAVLPLRLGELARAYLLGEKEAISKVATLATVAVCRAFDGLALLFVVVILALFLPMADWLKPAIYIAAAAFLGILIVFLLLASSRGRLQRLTAFLWRPLPPRWRAKLQDWLDRFVTGLEAIRSPKKSVFIFLLSVITWVGEGTMFYLLSFSFNLEQPFYVILMASTAANLALLIPSSPGGFGNFEYFSIQALVFFGVAGSPARAYAIAAHGISLLPIVLLGFYFLWVENLSLADLTRRTEKDTRRPDSRREGVSADDG